MSKEVISMAGKAVGAYTTRGGRSYTPDDVGDFLNKFKLYGALRLIGGISYGLFFMQLPTERLIQGVPITDSILAYLAMRLIESSNDHRRETMTLGDLLKAMDMYWGLPDPIEVEQNTASCLLRFGSNQFDYQRRMHNLLPRTLAIYRDIWPTVPDAGDITGALKDITGLTVEEVLMMCFAYTSRARAQQGFFRTYAEHVVRGDGGEEVFTQEKQKRFLDWISCDYRTFRQMSKAELKKAPGTR